MRYNIRHINYAMLLRVLGWLLMIEAGFLMVPMLTAVIYNEADLSAFAVAETVTLLTGIALTTLLRPRRTDMGRHEGFLLTASVWIVFSFFGMIPFLLSTSPIGISDAFFEAMSGFTTTGCTVLTSVEGMSHSILSLIHI